MRKFFTRTKAKAQAKMIQIAVLLTARRGENFVDSGVKILIAVVIGALLLSGLYALFGDTHYAYCNAESKRDVFVQGLKGGIYEN